MSGSKIFDKLLDKATSQFLLENDWESILQICDLIRQNDVAPKYAIGQIKKKLTNDNIHVISFSLEVIESLVKNCGSKIHQEIAQKDFMEQLKTLCKTKSDPIKTKILQLIQCWSHAFKKNPNYKIVEDFFNQMKMEGFQFPALKESEAMFDVEEAPLWIQDSEATNCFRCRTEFSTIRRRHHCRACGQIFCHTCSSKQAPIPKFGIEKEVRVCDACYDKLKTNPSTISSNPNSASKADLKPVVTKSAEKTEQEFEEELQLALAISESEAEAKKQQQKKFSNFTSNLKEDYSLYPNTANIKSTASAPYLAETETKFNKKETEPVKQKVKFADEIVQNEENEPNDEEKKIDLEIDQFTEEANKLLELFINRMKSNSIRGRPITNDTAVQSLFLQLQQMQPKLYSFIKYKEDLRAYYENLQDKLTQLKDAREVLNALRQESYEKKKREFEEKERLRQMQIAQKLQYMRQQKQSYYLYQQQLNFQRIQEQERDLQMRLNQQREMVLKREFINTSATPNSTNNLNFQIPNQIPTPMAGYNNLPINSELQFQQYQSQMPPQSLIQPSLPIQPKNQTQIAVEPQMQPQLPIQSQIQPQLPIQSHIQQQLPTTQTFDQNIYQNQYYQQAYQQVIPPVGNFQQSFYQTQTPNQLGPIPGQVPFQQKIESLVQQPQIQTSQVEPVKEAQLISFD